MNEEVLMLTIGMMERQKGYVYNSSKISETFNYYAMIQSVKKALTVFNKL